MAKRKAAKKPAKSSKLAARQTPAKKSSAKRDTAPKDAKTASAAAGKRILLVDDDSTTIDSMRFAFEQAGYDVHTAADGAEALAILDSVNPHLIVLDIMMPKISGYEVLGDLRRRSPRPLPVIMVTANEARGHETFAGVLGASEMIRKPFAMRTLLDAVERHLSQPS